MTKESLPFIERSSAGASIRAGRADKSGRSLRNGGESFIQKERTNQGMTAMKLVRSDSETGKTVIEFDGSEFSDLLGIVSAVDNQYSALDREILNIPEARVEAIANALFAIADEKQSLT